MAKYRAIYQTIWKDPDFQKYSPDAKLAFVYLCTNESTSESGVYAITDKTIADETGLKRETIARLLDKNLKNVIYDQDGHFIYVRKFRLYNAGGRPELVQKAIATEYRLSKQSYLWSFFIEDYPEFKEAIMAICPPLEPPYPTGNTKTSAKSKSIEPLANGLPTVSQPLPLDMKTAAETVCQPLPNGLPTVSQPLPNGLPTVNPTPAAIAKEPKHQYGDFSNVLLTDKQLASLKAKFEDWSERLDNFSQQKAAKGYRYDNDYAAILVWARRDKSKHSNDEQPVGPKIIEIA